MFNIFKKKSKRRRWNGGYPRPKRHPIAMKLFEPPPGHVGPYKPTRREVNARFEEMLAKKANRADGEDDATR